MKNNRILITIILLSVFTVFFTQNIFAQINDKISMKCIQKVEIFSSGRTENLKLIVLIPKDYKYRQKINKMNFTVKPVRVFEDDNNNYAEFFFKVITGHSEVFITTFMDIFKFDLYTSKYVTTYTSEASEKNIYKYLQSEQFIESDNPLMIAASDKLYAGNKMDSVIIIYDFIKSTIKYMPQEKNSGAVYALTNKSGTYSDIAYLFVALCRVKRIPARHVMGYFKFQPYAWIEVYFEEFGGWIPFDPISDRSNISTFDILTNNYIYYSYKANDKIINNTYGNYWWEGEEPIISGNTDIIMLK